MQQALKEISVYSATLRAVKTNWSTLYCTTLCAVKTDLQLEMLLEMHWTVMNDIF